MKNRMHRGIEAVHTSKRANTYMDEMNENLGSVKSLLLRLIHKEIFGGH